MIESLTKLFDPYNREARVFPAILTLVPALLFVLVTSPLLLGDFPKNTLLVVALLSIAYLFAGIARSAGKKIETKLVDSWGGWPTTTLLRHRDANIDGVTKARYHGALSQMCSGMAWPSPDDEAKSPNEADMKYASAISALRERRRGDEYSLVLHENASYGFRRNMLGLRPFAFSIALMAALGAGALLATQLLHQTSAPAMLGTVEADPRYALLVVVDVAVAIAWAVWVRGAWVLQAATDYAKVLLHSLDAATP